MGRVMGCGLCPYNAIEKVGNYATYTQIPKLMGNERDKQS